MAENLPSPSINLIKNKEISVFDKFLNWTLSIGRLIIILTEVIAVIAFLYRFSLDDKLVNLHTAIKQQQNIILSMRADENNYRNLQERLDLADRLSSKGIKFNETILSIANMINSQAKINNLTINKEKLTLDVEVPSVSSLAIFMDSLKNQKNIKSINIDNIANKSSAGLSINLTALLK